MATCLRRLALRARPPEMTLTITSDHPATKQMRQALVAAANADGGWGYYPNHPSRLEPTCWALLALRAEELAGDPDAAAPSQFLLQSQRPDGLLLEPAISEEGRPNLAFNGLAALLIQQHPDLAPETFRRALASGLAQNKGIKLPASELYRQDNALQGWAWIDGSFSWVEPTCWCALALKKSASVSPDVRARISEAERLLADRCCKAGGWNFGNSNILGEDLRPYVPTTALGLLALQDRRHEAFVIRSLDHLVKHRLSEGSAMALALTSIALRAFGVPAEDVDARLLLQWERTGFLGNSHLMAMALYSLTQGPQAQGAFRV
jgi:hypothetical protein